MRWFNIYVAGNYCWQLVSMDPLWRRTHLNVVLQLINVNLCLVTVKMPEGLQHCPLVQSCL